MFALFSVFLCFKHPSYGRIVIFSKNFKNLFSQTCFLSGNLSTGCFEILQKDSKENGPVRFKLLVASLKQTV